MLLEESTTISENGNANEPHEIQLDVAPEPEKITTDQLITSFIKAYGDTGTTPQQEGVTNLIRNYLIQEASQYSCYTKYNIVCLYDDGTLVKSDADKLYNAVTKFTEDKPLLLVLYSNGGSLGSAYLIGKLCREYSNGSFVITVPRKAKSAATIICCAANEIHMGSLSELGPVDPQIKDLPALGLKNSVDHIAELAKKYPDAAEMFAKYLHLSLDLINLGYYERVAESASQYAERLLHTHANLLPRSPREIARELVYKYKDHGFVIDKQEAEEIFGNTVIRQNTDEYELGNSLYKAFDLIKTLASFKNYSFYFIGSLESEGVFTKKSSAANT